MLSELNIILRQTNNYKAAHLLNINWELCYQLEVQTKFKIRSNLHKLIYCLSDLHCSNHQKHLRLYNPLTGS